MCSPKISAVNCVSEPVGLDGDRARHVSLARDHQMLRPDAAGHHLAHRRLANSRQGDCPSLTIVKDKFPIQLGDGAFDEIHRGESQ